MIVPEGIIFQSGNAYKNLRKMLVENYLWAVVSLPAGVFQPYSGVKTSILHMDKTLSKKTNKVLFVKIENDGFDLGAQRRPIDKNDLPQTLNFIKDYYQAVLNNTEVENTDFALAVEKSMIVESGDWNLSGERYKDNKSIQNHHWDMVALRVVAKFVQGTQVPLENQKTEYEDGLIRFIRIVDYTQETEDIRYVENKGERFICDENEIIMVRYGASAGFTGRGIKGIFANNLFAIRLTTERISDDFLYHCFKSDKFKSFIKANVLQAAMPALSHSMIGNFQIPLPPLDVQEAIVAEINGYQKIIDGAWQVVDNYKPTIKIDPKWPMVELGEVCQFKRGPFGGSLKKDIFVKDGYKVYEQKHAIKNNFEIGGYYITEDKYNEMIDFALKPNDLIISCSGTMGRIAIVPEKIKVGIINQALLKLTPKSDKVNPIFIKYILESNFIQKKYFRNTAGAAIQNVASVKVLKSIEVPHPPLSVQQEIVSQIEAEQEIVNANKKLITIYEQKIKDKISEIWGDSKK